MVIMLPGEGENNFKYAANSYPMNWTVKNWFAQDIWIVMIGNQLKLVLGRVLCGIE